MLLRHTCGVAVAPLGRSPSGKGEQALAAPERAGCYALRVSEGTLTKAALVEEVADVAGLTKKRAEIIVETVFGSIAEALRHGEKAEVRGFGSFRLRRRAPHRGRNPRTGERVDVPSKRIAYFTAGKELKALINWNPAQAVSPPSSE